MLVFVPLTATTASTAGRRAVDSSPGHVPTAPALRIAIAAATPSCVREEQIILIPEQIGHIISTCFFRFRA